jgi:hypothetical protein
MVGNMRDYFKYKDESGLSIRKAQAKKMFGKPLDALTESQKNKLEAELMSGKYNLSEIENKELGNLSFDIIKTPATYTTQLFKSLGDLIGILEEDSSVDKLKRFVGNIGRGVASPRYLGEVRDILDNKLYDTKEFRNMLGANVPFVTLGGVKLDGFGREIEKYQSESALSGVKYMLTRRFYNEPKVTELDQFLWENRIFVKPPTNGPNLAYSKEAERDYVVERGAILLKMIEDGLKNRKFEKRDNKGVVSPLTPQEILERINRYTEMANEKAQNIIDKKYK